MRMGMFETGYRFGAVENDRQPRGDVAILLRNSRRRGPVTDDGPTVQLSLVKAL